VKEKAMMRERENARVPWILGGLALGAALLVTGIGGAAAPGG